MSTSHNTGSSNYLEMTLSLALFLIILSFSPCFLLTILFPLALPLPSRRDHFFFFSTISSKRSFFFPNSKEFHTILSKFIDKHVSLQFRYCFLSFLLLFHDNLHKLSAQKWFEKKKNNGKENIITKLKQAIIIRKKKSRNNGEPFCCSFRSEMHSKIEH